MNTPNNFSPSVYSLLKKYPEWYSIVSEAINKPLLDKNYSSQILEIFDQYGLLAGRVHGKYSYECTRSVDQKSEFNAWFFDEELVIFYVGKELVINRLQILYSEECK